MVAIKTPTLAASYAGLCAFLKTSPKLTVIVANHIAAKHQIHSLPAFHTSDAVPEEEKLVTYGEIIRALASKKHETLRGQVAGGQAAETEHPLPTRGAILPVAEPPPPDPLAAKQRAAAAAMKKLKPFIGATQLAAVKEAMNGEEKEFFFDKLIELAGVVDRMPKTHETDGQMDQAIVHLHYFAGGAGNWYITEKDKGAKDDEAGQEQSQAFGWADPMGDPSCAEFGYISIGEILGAGGELDFHWTPKPVGDVRPKKAPAERLPEMGDENLPEIANPAAWSRKPGDIQDAVEMAFGEDKGDGHISHPVPFRPSRIVATQQLSTGAFDAFCRSFGEDVEWLKNQGGSNQTHYASVLVTAPDRPRLLINPEGHTYARYVGLFVADREAWLKLAPSVTPPPCDTPRSGVPRNDADLHVQLDSILAVICKIPGATVSLQINLPVQR